MTQQATLEIPAILWDAVSAMRSAARPLTAYVIAIFVVQSFTGIFLSQELLARQGFSSSDWFFLGVSLLIQTYLWCGLLVSAVHASRGESPPASAIFPPFGAFIRGTIVILAAMIPFAIGLILLIVPGAYLALVWSQAYPLILDGRARFFDSLRMSAELTRGLRGKLFLAFLVPGLLEIPARVINRMSDKLEFFDSLLGAMVLIVVGVYEILVTAFATFVIAVLYQRLRQRRAGQLGIDFSRVIETSPDEVSDELPVTQTESRQCPVCGVQNHAPLRRCKRCGYDFYQEQP